MEIKRITEDELGIHPDILNGIIDAKIAYYGFDSISLDERLEIQKDIIGEVRQGSDYFVLLINGIVRGYTHGYINGDWYQSAGTFICQNLRGKGLAIQLKQAQIGYANRINNCVGMRVGVIETNSSSLRMIEKLGFVVTEVRNGAILALLRFK